MPADEDIVDVLKRRRLLRIRAIARFAAAGADEYELNTQLRQLLRGARLV